MSRKPVTDTRFHDGSAPNCAQFTRVIGAGHAANLDRSCPHQSCENKPRSETRRGRRKAVRP